MKPLIGITLHEEGQKFTLNHAYAQCIAKAGAIPILLPHATLVAASEVMRFVSGLLLTGGGDVDPIYFGEDPQPALGTIYPERDSWEVELSQLFLKQNKPILGICRGIQLLNVAAGGTLWQTIANKKIKHFQEAPNSYVTHSVKISENSKIFQIMETHTARVNSLHHQAVRTTAPGFKEVCFAADGTIEAIESEEHNFAIGVQWHPEHLWEYHETRQLFSAFISAAIPR